MEKIVFSDTEYFYTKFQELVYSSEILEIITDFQSTAQIPRRGKRLLRMACGKYGKRGKHIVGPVLNKKYQVRLEHDIYNRLKLVISKVL
ncbi:MAG: hypothetical protein U9N77_06925 [Thermodesulfobacteriota bacterium]|nr:hypothetical protein [Thermodesulfobacteriota bacterium]